MSAKAVILSATTALFAASTLYFAWAVGVERNRGDEFRAARGAMPSLADVGPADSNTGANSATSAGVSADSNGTPSAKSPGLLDGLRGLSGGSKRMSPQQSSELYKQDFERMFADPATRKRLIEELIPTYRDQFIVLERRLDLPSDQWQRFLETVATHAIERRGASSICAQDVECQKRSLGQEAYARDDQEIRDVLGDADMKQYQTFNYAVSERQSVEMLQARLPLSQQLSEKAAEDLITALSEVRRAAEQSIQEADGSFVTFRGDGYVVVYPSDLKTLEERFDYAAGNLKNLRDRAGALLNPVQLSAYQEQHRESLRKLRRAMAATPGVR